MNYICDVYDVNVNLLIIQLFFKFTIILNYFHYFFKLF